jgi:hypothetical protein
MILLDPADRVASPGTEDDKDTAAGTPSAVGSSEVGPEGIACHQSRDLHAGNHIGCCNMHPVPDPDSMVPVPTARLGCRSLCYLDQTIFRRSCLPDHRSKAWSTAALGSPGVRSLKNLHGSWVLEISQ